MGRKSREKKRRRKRKQLAKSDKFIVRGQSERGDFILELVKFIEAYQADFGKHPFEGLEEKQRETVIDMLLILRKAGKLPRIWDDPETYKEVLEHAVEAERRHPSVDPNATPTIDNIANEMLDGRTVKEVKDEAMGALLTAGKSKEEIRQEIAKKSPAMAMAFDDRFPDVLRAVQGEGEELYPGYGYPEDPNEGLNIALRPEGDDRKVIPVKLNAEERRQIEGGARAAGVSVEHFLRMGIGQQLIKETIRDVKRSRRHVLDQYLMAQNVLTNPKRTEEGVGTFSDDTGNRVWAVMRQARIFEIPVTLFTTLYHESDKFVCKQAGVEWCFPGERDIPQEELDLYRETFQELREEWQLPAHLPFEAMFLGIDHSVYLTPDQRDALYVPKAVDRCSWMGFLVTATFACVLLRTEDLKGQQDGVYLSVEMNEGIWVPDMLTSTPFVIAWLIEWINDHQTCVQEGSGGFGHRHDYKKLAKRWSIKRPIPAPYYTVYIKDELINQDAWLEKLRKRQSVRPRRSPQHQYDVRGSWVCRIMRGPLPLDPKLEQQLRRDKRRKIYTHERPDAETAQHLLKRGISPKKVDEWMSVLIYWRKDHRRGPEDGPYVPSVRKSARKKAVGE